MKHRRRRNADTARRRTIPTSPADAGAVISEALSDGLRTRVPAQRSEEVLSAYKKAFGGFSDEEMSVLDGILLEPVTTRR